MYLVNAERSHLSTVRTEWSTTAASGHLYWAFTEGVGDWLGDPISNTSVIEPGIAFCIRAKREWGGGAHYGRVVDLRRDRRIALKWISESLGGVESDVVIDMTPTGHGTDVRVAHRGFTDPEVRMRVERFWERVPGVIDSIISSSQPHA